MIDWDYERSRCAFPSKDDEEKNDDQSRVSMPEMSAGLRTAAQHEVDPSAAKLSVLDGLLNAVRFALDEARRTISMDHPVRLHIESAVADIDFFRTMNAEVDAEAGAQAATLPDTTRIIHSVEIA